MKQSVSNIYKTSGMLKNDAAERGRILATIGVDTATDRPRKVKKEYDIYGKVCIHEKEETQNCSP